MKYSLPIVEFPIETSFQNTFEGLLSNESVYDKK
jgi:hypothetical protein